MEFAVIIKQRRLNHQEEAIFRYRKEWGGGARRVPTTKKTETVLLRKLEEIFDLGGEETVELLDKLFDIVLSEAILPPLIL